MNMDHNMDFGMNLAQDAMSSSQKRENFQPGYGDDMRNATQSFLAAELGGGFVEPAKTTAQGTSEFQNLMDDFDMTKNSMFRPTQEETHHLISDGVNKVTANIGDAVNLEFKVEPDNIKLISSDTLLDDFEPTQTRFNPSAKEHSYDYDDKPKHDKAEKTKSSNLMDDFSDFMSQPSAKQPESHIQQFSDNEDDIFKSPIEFSPAKQKSNAESDNEKFISAENFGMDDFRSTIPKVIDDIKEKASDILKPAAPAAASSSTSKNIFKTEPPKTNVLQGEVLFHSQRGGKTIHPQLESLLYWRDPKLSGIVFGCGLIVLLALSWFSVISVFAYTSLITLTGTVGFRIYKYVLGLMNDTKEGHPFEAYLNGDIELSQERVRQITNTCAANINAFIVELRKLFLVEDYIESIKFAVILLILAYIGSWFNGMTLIILAYILAFAVPPLYEQNKSIIDEKLEFISTKIAEISGITFGRQNVAVESGKTK